jgi:hypothetical protein
MNKNSVSNLFNRCAVPTVCNVSALLFVEQYSNNSSLRLWSMQKMLKINGQKVAVSFFANPLLLLISHSASGKNESATATVRRDFSGSRMPRPFRYLSALGS